MSKALEIRLVFLTPGQQAPPGSTGTVLSNGGLAWSGDVGMFPAEALLEEHYEGDIEPATTYNHRKATTAEELELIDIGIRALQEPPRW